MQQRTTNGDPEEAGELLRPEKHTFPGGGHGYQQPTEAVSERGLPAPQGFVMRQPMGLLEAYYLSKL